MKIILLEENKIIEFLSNFSNKKFIQHFSFF
jgi:hypothetical protein